jgi:hypothetical protein
MRSNIVFLNSVKLWIIIIKIIIMPLMSKRFDSVGGGKKIFYNYLNNKIIKLLLEPNRLELFLLFLKKKYIMNLLDCF